MGIPGASFPFSYTLTYEADSNRFQNRRAFFPLSNPELIEPPLIPLIIAMGNDGVDVVPLWWAVSLGACLGGNGTLIGASANVVLCGISGKHGHPITFQRFLNVLYPSK